MINDCKSSALVHEITDSTYPSIVYFFSNCLIKFIRTNLFPGKQFKKRLKRSKGTMWGRKEKGGKRKKIEKDGEIRKVGACMCFVGYVGVIFYFFCL